MAILGRVDAATVAIGDITATTNRALFNADPAVGTLTLGRSNVVVQLPVLPYPLYNGKVSWEEPFNGNTSGSIEYDCVPLWEFKLIQQAYANGTKFSIYGIPFEVTTSPQWEYLRNTPDPSIASPAPVYYKVTIQLTGANRVIPSELQTQAEQIGYLSYITKEAVSLDGNTRYGIVGNSGNPQFTGLAINASMNSGSLGGVTATITSSGSYTFQQQAMSAQGWTFPDEEIVSFTGSNAAILNGYNNAELTWDADGDQGDTDKNNSRVIFIPKEPLIEVFVEESRKFDEVPENTYSLRDLTSNFDQTGDKKVRRITTNINGKPDREEIYTKGLSYVMAQIWDAAKKELHGTDPQSFWVDIEYRKTRYIYKNAGAIRLEFAFKSPNGEEITTVVHPDYWGYANVSIGAGIASMRSTAEYLVEKSTTGWMLARLKAEDNDRNTLYAKDPYYPYFFPKPIPLLERTIYFLRSSRGQYGEKIDPPFTVQYSDWSSLDPRIKAIIGAGNASPQGKVAIITPDLNFVEPLYIEREESYTNSFAWAVDPDADKPDPNKFIPGTDVVVPAAHLKTGQESVNEAERAIRRPDFNDDGTVRQKYYAERSKSWSSSDPGFDNSTEQIVFKDASGDPPAADYRQITYDKVSLNIGGTAATLSSTAQQNNISYYITTPDNASTIASGESASASGAKNLGEAVARINLDLRREAMSKITSDCELRGFYPMMRCGQPLSLLRDRDINTPKGIWRVTNVSHQLNYLGMNEELGLTVTHEPTKITRGLDVERPIVVSSGPGDKDKNGGTGGGDPTIDVVLAQDAGTVEADLLPGVQTRRNYG